MIVRAWHQERLTYAAIASLLGVGEATVSRVLRLHREKASVAPRPHGGGNRSPIRGDVAKALERLVRELPDATLDESKEALMKSADVKTSRAAVLRALQRLGYSRKKKTFTALERDTPERRAYRRSFCSWLTSTLSTRLVFIDESFCITGMRREFGWSRRGDRVEGKRMGASWKTLSLIGAMRLGERHALAPAYRPRRPQDTVLHRVVREHLETFLAHARESYDAPLPKYVQGELRGYVRCGIFDHGFTRAHCDACGHDLLVAFSCKARGLCPSCAGRRMANTAAHLVDRVFPSVPVRGSSRSRSTSAPAPPSTRSS